MRAARGAFTLVEVMLGSTLGLMLLGLFVFTLIPLLRYGSWTSARATLVQAAVLVGDRLGADLQRAPLAAIGLDSASVSIHPVVGATDSGTPVWHSRLVVYEWNGGDLRRGEVGANPNLAPQRLTLSEVRTALAVVRPNRLVKGILKDLRVTTSGGDLPLVIRLRLETPVPGRAPERFDYTREVMLRCGT